MSAEPSEERREVHYSGRVQGVGFRYTVRLLASRFAVAGFVRNLADGRVQLVAEGPPNEVQRLLDAIDAEMGHYIVQHEDHPAPASGTFHGFEIRF